MNIVDRLNHHLFKDTVLNYFHCSFPKTVSLNQLIYLVIMTDKLYTNRTKFVKIIS